MTDSISIPGWLSSLHIQEIYHLKWDSPVGIPSGLVADPGSFLGTAKPGPKIRQWVNIIQSPDGTIYIRRDAELYRLNGEGKVFQTLSLKFPDSESPFILEAVADESGQIYALVEFADKSHYLAAWDGSGNLVWKKAIAPELTHIHFCEGMLWAEYHSPEKTSLQQWAKDGSEFLEVLKGPADWERIFPSSRDEAHYVSYDEETGMRNWVSVDLETKVKTIADGNQELFGLLALPWGTDSKGRGYGVSGFEMGCIQRNGATAFKIKLDNLLPETNSNSLLISDWDRENLTLKVYKYNPESDNKEVRVISIPEKIQTQCHQPIWKLVSQEGNLFYIHGRNGSDLSINWLEYNSLSEELKPFSPSADQELQLQYILQPAGDWAISRSGELLLPVLGPDALSIYKVSFL
ncbi:MAG: hypothetical protein H6581_10925 [Bacteroidia bacterium]|nr:hypothetical protein [Bacteroidia bacterium]